MKIRYIESLISCALVLCIGCTRPIQQSGQAQQEKKTASSSSVESEENNDVNPWTYYYNLKSDSLQYLYAENSIRILESGEVLNGRDQIKDSILKSTLRLESVKRDTLLLAHKGRAIEYEISENIYDQDEKEKVLTIWQTKNQERKRVFEFVSKVEASKIDHLALNERRRQWMVLCNKHNAKNLIDELYSENTLYYNHKPIVKGRAQLTQEYGYMNNEKYNLALAPEIVDKVNENIIFELGQCSGSYGGKYIIIWRKEKDGEWRIFIDSNI